MRSSQICFKLDSWPKYDYVSKTMLTNLLFLFKDTKETATKINTQKHKAFMAKRRWKVGSVWEIIIYPMP